MRRMHGALGREMGRPERVIRARDPVKGMTVWFRLNRNAPFMGGTVEQAGLSTVRIMSHDGRVIRITRSAWGFSFDVWEAA